MAWRGLDEIVAEEMAVLPGMEELSGLLYLLTYYDEKAYDTVIVDCAPTGETLRLLSFPEVMSLVAPAHLPHPARRHPHRPPDPAAASPTCRSPTTRSSTPRTTSCSSSSGCATSSPIRRTPASAS